jgi:uncharacterized integral membrane protein
MSEKDFKAKTYKAPSWKLLVVHAIVYGIIIAIMWIVFAHQNKASFGRTYPWPAWFTTGLGIILLGHICNVFFDSNRNLEDKYYEKYLWEKDH